jgi:hypothetical protein
MYLDLVTYPMPVFGSWIDEGTFASLVYKFNYWFIDSANHIDYIYIYIYINYFLYIINSQYVIFFKNQPDLRVKTMEILNSLFPMVWSPSFLYQFSKHMIKKKEINKEKEMQDHVYVFYENECRCTTYVILML